MPEGYSGPWLEGFLSEQTSHSDALAVVESGIKHKSSSVRLVIGPVEGFMNVTHAGEHPFVASVSHHPATSILDRPPKKSAR